MNLPSRGALLASSCAALAVLLAGYAAWDQGWTYDERIHLGWSQQLLEGETDRTALRRYESKTPVSIFNVLAGRLAPDGAGARATRFASRLPQLLWLAALLAATFAFARGRWGGRVAAISVALVALDPNVIAHSSVVTVDTPYALATLVFAWTALRFAEGPDVRRAMLLGVALGAALAVKFTAVLLIVSLAALVAIPLPALRSPPRAMVTVLGAATAACMTLSAAYLFAGFGVSLGKLELHSIIGRLPLVQGVPLPLPEPFITGLDLTLHGERTVSFPVWLLGQSFPDGVPYYFLALWLIKTPLAIIAAHVVGILAVFGSAQLRREPALRFLTLVALIHLAYFSLLFRTQVGYRFVLMCLPLLAIVAARGLARLLASRRTVAVGLLGLAFAAGENLLYWGDPLAFSNAAIWPKHSVFRLMADSNLAWGQNRERLEPLLERLRATQTRVDPVHLLPGSNTINVNELTGVTAPLERHRWLRDNATADGLYTHSFVRFLVSDEQYERYLAEERSFAPHELAETMCERADWQRYPPGSRVPFSRDEQPAEGARTVACVETSEPAELGVRIVRGHIKAGVFDPAGKCEATRLTGQRVLWSRLLPGRHALCLEEIPNRRDYIPYAVDAVVVVRRHGASIALLPEG